MTGFLCKCTFEWLKVIEHVADPADFCKSLSALTIPEGAIVISTINRSMRAYATAIVAAEYLLRWVCFFSFLPDFICAIDSIAMHEYCSLSCFKMHVIF